MDTPNPAMDCEDVGGDGTVDMLTKEESAKRLRTECKNLLSEIGMFAPAREMILHTIAAVAGETWDVKKY
jgi:hypothetical protein